MQKCIFGDFRPGKIQTTCSATETNVLFFTFENEF